MALQWQSIDLTSGDELAYSGDPAELVAELVELSHRPQWQAQAACRGMGTAAWFPSQGERGADAQAVCGRCPVTAACLAAALANSSTGHDYGIWGGTTARERRAMRRRAAA